MIRICFQQSSDCLDNRGALSRSKSRSCFLLNIRRSGRGLSPRFSPNRLVPNKTLLDRSLSYGHHVVLQRCDLSLFGDATVRVRPVLKSLVVFERLQIVGLSNCVSRLMFTVIISLDHEVNV